LRRCTRRGVSLAVAAAAAKWLTCRLQCGGWPAVPAFSPCLMRRLACPALFERCGCSRGQSRTAVRRGARGLRVRRW
jgi:hypothetical protein